MKNKLSAIIIYDGDIDVSEIKNSVYGSDTAETDFEIKHVNNDENISDVLNEFRYYDAIITIGGSDVDYENMMKMPYFVRCKWAHMNEYNTDEIGGNIIGVFQSNINRKHDKSCELFSVFTSVYNTKKEYIDRLYGSLKRQTYTNWNWWIIDDSDNDECYEYIKSLNDFRINVIKNCTTHGNIGYNKHVIAMACNGDYLVEVDHDDELTSDCLEMLHNAFIKYPLTDFAYSYALEEINGEPIVYGDGWGWGYGLTRTEKVNGLECTFSQSPDVNAVTIRLIFSQPNHVRCWRSKFYREIGGHNMELSVLDDQELLIRTFLKGRMCKIDKTLYIQHEGENERGENGDTAQSARFREIQRTTWIIKEAYDSLIHERVLQLGYTDPIWHDEFNASIPYDDHDRESVEPINYTYYCD